MVGHGGDRGVTVAPRLGLKDPYDHDTDNEVCEERRRSHRLSSGGRGRPEPGTGAGLGVAHRVRVGGPVLFPFLAAPRVLLTAHPPRPTRHRTVRPRE